MAARSKNVTEDIEIKDKQQDLMNEDVIDIEFKELQKKRFRLDRDNARVIELNISDISVLSRAEEFYPKLLKLVEDARVAIEDGEKDGEMDNATTARVLDEINSKMKELINYIFDSDVADKACPSGTLFDPINGKFRFEYIMEKLMTLYGDNIAKEFTLVQKRVERHTSKYTKKRK